MPRVKQRTPELRDRVLAVAVAVLSEDGVSGFTTRWVADSAETSVPAIPATGARTDRRRGDRRSA